MRKNRNEYHRNYQKNRYHSDKDFREKYKSYQKTHYKRYQKDIQTQRQHEKRLVITYYSKGTMKCLCCRESMYEFLTVDHINNDGNKQRKLLKRNNIYSWLIKNNFPPGLQILCWNCNMAKARNNGVCPHITNRL